MDSAEVAAVHGDEVSALLDRLGVRDAYSSGALACSICEAPLIEAGLGAVRGTNEGVVFACEKLDCLDDFHAHA